MSADNQQERLDNKWVSGFVDGEGCFYVGINKIQNMTLGWQVLPEFRLVQHKKNIFVLKKVQELFGYGVITRNHGDRFELRVRKIGDLKKLIEFFQQNPLMTTKKDDFNLFKKIIYLMDKKEHLKEEELKAIAKLSSEMNRKIKPKFLESSETIRPTS